MKSRDRAKLYLACLDRVLAGEKDIGPVEDKEIAVLLHHSKAMLTVSACVDGRLQECLRRSLWEKASSSWVPLAYPAGLRPPEGELTEDDLMHVAAAQ